MRCRGKLEAAVALALLAGCTTAPHPSPENGSETETGSSSTGRTISFGVGVQSTYFEEGLKEAEVVGRYSRTLDITHGVRVFLYPDNQYVTVLFCDICVPEVFSRGAWRLEKNRIVLSETFRNPSPEIPVWEDIASVRSFLIVATHSADNRVDSSFLIPEEVWRETPPRGKVSIMQRWVQEPLEEDWQVTRQWLRDWTTGETAPEPAN